MAHRVLEKLDKLKAFEKKIMRKYELIDCPELGRMQYSPFVKNPLMSEFKLDYELSKDAEKRMLATPNLFEYGQCVFQGLESVCRPRSAVSLQLPKKKRLDKRAGRPFTAPASLGDQKGNLEALSDGFVILKLKSPAESQKRSKSVSKDISKISHHTDVPYEYFTTAPGSWHKESSVVMVKDEKLSTIYESRSQDVPRLGKDDTVRSLSHDRLQGDSDTRAGSLLRVALSHEIQRMARRIDPDWILKKPLCIEDEFKKPNAKIIRTDVEGVKLPSPMKVSESFPVYCSNEGYVRKYVLNRWLTLYGDKAFYDTSKKDEVHVRLNPVLQNNFNESFAILRSRKQTLPPLPTKKKKHFSPKPKTITSFQILAMKRKLDLPPYPQKERPSEEKLSSSVLPNKDYSVWKRTLLQKNISESIPKCRKDVFMVHGTNPATETHEVSTSNLIKKIKSEFPCCTEKPGVQRRKRDRLMHMEYIPISKPISVHASESELLDPSLSDSQTLLLSESSDFTLIGRDKPEAHLHKKYSLEESRLGGVEFIVSRYTTLAPERSEKYSRPASAATPRSFHSESSDSSKSSKTSKRAVRVISIPTAEYDAPESYSSLQKEDSMDT